MIQFQEKNLDRRTDGRTEGQTDPIRLPPGVQLHTIHWQLNLINVLEFAILLMTYLIEYVFQIKQKI